MDEALLDLAFLDFFVAGLDFFIFAFVVLVFFALVVFFAFAFAALGFFPLACAVLVFFVFALFFAFAFADLALVDLLRLLDAAIPYPFCEPLVSGPLCPVSGSTIRHGNQSGA
jgi:hypothetical protein